MACPGCGFGDNPADANFCENCGADFSQASAAAVVSSASLAEGAPPAAPIATQAPSELTGATLPLPAAAGVAQGETQALLTWICTCGQENPAAEEYCEACGAARPVFTAVLSPGSAFAGVTVVSRLDGQTYAVQSSTKAGDATMGAVLRFGEPAALSALAATLDDLDAAALEAATGAALVPLVLARGTDAVRGAYLVLSQPPGNWSPLGAAAGLAPAAAAELLSRLLYVVEQAAARKRLLLLSPAQVLVANALPFLPQPVAPSLPLSSALLADPAYLAPEVRAGETAPDAWAAGAYAAAALVQAATGASLGFSKEWHALLARLRDQDAARRPASLAEVAAALKTAAARRFVSIHRTAFQTDIGHHHPVNQDAGGVWTWQRRDGTPVTLAVVADGVSAGKYSEKASALTVDLIQSVIARHFGDREFTPDIADRLLLDAGIQAHQQVSAMPYDSYDEANATTLVAACVIGDTVTGMWCGDSRAYGVTPAGCGQITHDHSWVNLMVESGRMSLEQARLDRRAHVIARWLGVSDPPSANPGFDRFRRELAPGDRLLVCSDGLYMYFEPPAEDDPCAMAGVINGHGDDVEGAVGELVQTALDRGGFDNITAVLVAIQ